MTVEGLAVGDPMRTCGALAILALVVAGCSRTTPPSLTYGEAMQAYEFELGEWRRLKQAHTADVQKLTDNQLTGMAQLSELGASDAKLREFMDKHSDAIEEYSKKAAKVLEVHRERTEAAKDLRDSLAP